MSAYRFRLMGVIIATCMSCAAVVYSDAHASTEADEPTSSLAQPAGPVLLRVGGAIERTNSADGAALDLEMLRAMGETEIVTETIWTSGSQTFVGVELEDLLRELGTDGTMINATAVNDYSVRIPVSDAVDGGPIIAYELNGKPMSRREKGPLWVIYPFSSSSDYRTEVIYSRSIWQLDRMIIE